MRAHGAVLFAAAVGGLIPLSTRADESAGGSWRTVESDTIAGWIGSFRPDNSDPAATGNGIAIGIGWERRRQSGLRYGIELDYYLADYRLPTGLSCGSFCSVDQTMTLDVWGIGPTVGYGKMLGPVDIYAGAGLGYYRSTMTATASQLGIPGEHDETDDGLGVDLRLGVKVDFGANSSLGIQMRQLSLSGNFGPLSSNHSMSIGGKSVLVSYGRRF